jgi:hypothetical protein
VKSSGDTIS